MQIPNRVNVWQKSQQLIVYIIRCQQQEKNSFFFLPPKTEDVSFKDESSEILIAEDGGKK